MAGVVIYYGARMPSASTWAIPERPPNLKIVAVDGTVLANRGTTGGEALSLEDMSPYIPQAVIAIEDRRFLLAFRRRSVGVAGGTGGDRGGAPGGFRHLRGGVSGEYPGDVGV